MHLWFSKESGWIEVITGSMFSGKSEELIRRMRRAKYANQEIVVFKHAFDKRYDKDKVVSHSKNEIEAIPAATAREIKEIVDSMPNVEVIGIDEIQFFGKEIAAIIEEFADNGKRVIAAGLDQDFRGEPFEPMPEIISRAEYVDKLSAICSCCGNPASRTQRIINGEPAYYDDPVIMVGASESYEARCRNCHEVKKRESEKNGKIYFIVGTDTEIGKTYVTLRFVEKGISDGKNIDVFKPVETGLEGFENYEGSDSYKYAKILGKEISDVNLYFFDKPMSPHLAARIDNKKIDIAAIKKGIEAKAEKCDILFVEGAGGLIVPYGDNITYLDLIKEFRKCAEVIVVARNGLGTINHTLMTVEILKENGIKIKGIHFNNKDKIKDDIFLNENIEAVKRLSGEKIIEGYEI